jgi:hypothetical protein
MRGQARAQLGELGLDEGHDLRAACIAAAKA